MSKAPRVDSNRVKTVFGQIEPKAWAHKLRQREADGDELTEAQRAMWRAALRSAGPLFGPQQSDGADIEQARAQTARRVAEYQGSGE